MNRNNVNSRNLEENGFGENQQRGREMWQESPQHWSGNNNPNSHTANRHHGSPNYQDFGNTGQYREQPAGNFGKQTQHNPYQPADRGWRHHDENVWTERNAYKDDDYRYRSGHRDHWHTNFERDHQDNRSHESRNYDNRNNENRHYENQHSNQGGFFSNIGHGISNAWHTITNHHNQNDHTHPENWHYENRRNNDENNRRFEERSW